MTDSTDRRPARVAQAGSGYAPIRPRLGMADYLVQAWRSKWLILAVAAPILALGVYLAVKTPVTYESRAVLYVSAPVPGQDVSQLAQGEREIFKTRLVAERTLSRFPLGRIYPGMRDASFQSGVAALQDSIRVTAVPDSNIVNVRVVHHDPQVAAELLNAAIAVYLQRRAEIFSDQGLTATVTEQRSFETELLQAEDAIRAFLVEHSIRDFASERATAHALHALVSGELLSVEARQKAVEAQLRRIRAQLAETPRELDLFVEDSTADRLFDLEIERNQVLVTYLPDSQRVQALEAQIADLRARLEARDPLQGTVRRGPNPTYQALEMSRNAFEAEADSLAQKQAELARQLAAVEAKLERFSGLESEWNALQRTRDTLENRVSTSIGVGDVPAVNQGHAATGTAGITIAEPATVPRTGRSAAGPVLILSILTALILSILITLLRAGSVRSFPTASAFERTTGLPVLAAIGHV